jgi:hypothetical protein
MFKKHNSHTVLLILFSTLTCCKSVYSQGNLSWYDLQEKAIHRISVLNGNHIVFYENHIDTLPSYQQDYDNSQLRLPGKGHHFAVDGRIITAFGGCGSVFALDTTSESITRLDLTFHTGYNFDAYQFVRRDTIYSFGGYGFWTENNLLTYFSELRKEWNVYSVGDFPPYTPDFEEGVTYKFAFYDEGVDELYVLRQKVFYKFSFANGQWARLGNLDLENTFPERGTFGVSNLHRLNDSTVMMMGGLKAYYVVPRNNIIYDVTMPNGLNANAGRGNSQLGFHCGYDLENELLLVKNSDKIEQGYLFEYVNRLPKRINSESQLYSHEILTSQAKFGFSLFGFLLIGGFLTYWIRTLYLKRRYQYFTEAQWKFIQRLDKGGLQTEDLNEFLQLGSSSWEVQRRKRSEYIKMINDLCLNQLGCELVLRQRSKEDKRQVLYVMNIEAKNKLARLM